jgi:hypothetical protein
VLVFHGKTCLIIGGGIKGNNIEFWCEKALFAQLGGTLNP